MQILEQESRYFLPVYERFPANIVDGEGCFLFDDSGKAYLDMLAGIAVNALGYRHPAVLSALQEHLRRPLHLSNYFVQEIQIKLAQKLLELTPYDKVFFSNSGTEAMEGLLKLAKKWGNENGRQEIIVFENSFHGRTLGAVSLTGQAVYQKSIGPLIPNIKILAADDTDAFLRVAGKNTCAVFFEGIAGQGGIRPLPQKMLQAIKQAKDEHGFLVICDEIQTGIARTGRMFYYEYFDFVPDAIAVAKAVGGGLPLGGFLVNNALAGVFKKGDHGTTYGGNPLACTAGLAVLETVTAPGFIEAVSAKGDYLAGRLRSWQQKYPGKVKSIRGAGLMLGAEVEGDNRLLMSKCFENGLILNLSGGTSTLRFVPPLIITEDEIDKGVDILEKTCSEIFK